MREKARVMATIFRAKNMSINTFLKNEPVCGYGVAFQGNQYFIYKDLPNWAERVNGSPSNVTFKNYVNK
jgi:hypothetical protein